MSLVQVGAHCFCPENLLGSLSSGAPQHQNPGMFWLSSWRLIACDTLFPVTEWLLELSLCIFIQQHSGQEKASLSFPKSKENFNQRPVVRIVIGHTSASCQQLAPGRKSPRLIYALKLEFTSQVFGGWIGKQGCFLLGSRGIGNNKGPKAINMVYLSIDVK